MVDTFENRRLFQTHQVPWLFDHAQLSRIAIGVGANRTGFRFGQIEATVTVPHILANAPDRIGQAQALLVADSQADERPTVRHFCGRFLAIVPDVGPIRKPLLHDSLIRSSA